MSLPETTKKLLEVRHLNVDYAADNGTVHAVNDVSFTLHQGEILGLAGESGSGKSTLAYAISRLLRPPALITGGEVLYYPRPQDEKLGKVAGIGDREQTDEVEVLTLTNSQLRAFRWRELSIVFQSAMNALNPVLNLETQIVDVLKAHNRSMSTDERRQRAAELLKLVGISSDRLRSYPHELSGGMRQRSIIAIALALSPEIIIMDEPTTALDVVVQRDILNEIKSLREQLGFAVIFITHDLSLLLETADRVAIMYAGRVVEMATRSELYHQPGHPYTYGLLNSFPSLHGPRRRMTGIPGTPPDLRAIPTGCAFHPRCTFAMDSCRQVLPALRKPDSPGTELTQQIACHLYNDRYNPQGARRTGFNHNEGRGQAIQTANNPPYTIKNLDVPTSGGKS